MAARSAEARWEGTLREGEGTITLASGAFEGKYSFTTRFEDGVTGTNPEELIAAAHAGCFSMALNNSLFMDGHNPTYVHSSSKVHMGRPNDIPTITKIDLTVEAEVPGMDEATFTEYAEKAKQNCIISRVLNVEEMTLSVTFKS